MKKIIATLFLFAAASFCLLFGCAQTPQISLSPPENIRIENGILTWDEVENASSYIVSFQGIDYACNENFYDLNGFSLEAGTALEVLAVNNGKNSVFSEPATYYYQVASPDIPPALTVTENLRYTLLSDQSGYEVSRGSADLEGTVVIPDLYKGLPVKKIADEAFFYNMLYTDPDTGYGCNTVTTKIVLPQYLEEIGSKAFKYCIALNEIELPATLTSIGESAFDYCCKLKKIAIPKRVTSIGDGAFGRCLELAEISMEEGIKLDYLGSSAFGQTVWYKNQPDGYLILNERFLYRHKGELPNGGVVSGLPPEVEVIVGGAFTGTNLTSITIREGIALSSQAFSYCKKLSHVDLPNDLKIIPERAFGNCTALSEIVLPQGLTAISSEAFTYSALTEIDIPEGVTKIGEQAFASCRSLSKIRLPSTLKFMGYLAFRDCEPLTSIEIPAMPELEHWDRSVFYECISLQEVILSEGITEIYPSAFIHCEKLTSIHIPESVIKIENSAFASCSALTEIALPSKITSIGEGAFMNCTSLTKIELPPSVTSIGDRAFENCKLLTNIQLPNSLIEIGQGAFGKCVFTELVIPDSVKKIGEGAFQECSLLTKIQLPKSLKKIENNTFLSCTNLTEITIPESVTEIGDEAFARCKSLTEIIIPEGVTKIGSYAFNGVLITEFILPSSLRETGEYILPKAKAFYCGSRADWEANVTMNGEPFFEPLYFYVELEADLPQDGGNYWHYAPDGKTPVIWE